MNVSQRVSTLEKSVLDEQEGDNELYRLDSETRDRILAAGFGENLERVQAEFIQSKTEEERLAIIEKYAIRSVSEAKALLGL